jgi:hypothetical protein
MRIRATRISLGMTALLLAVIACIGAETPSPTFAPPPNVEATATPLVPTTISYTPSSTVPLVTLLAPASCREGPGDVYREVATAIVGPKYLVIGNYSLQNYFIIVLPDERHCWLSGQSVVQDGNFSGLPEFAAPVGSIKGVVLNKLDSYPINEAPMRLAPSGMLTKTDDQGVYLFTGVPIGDVTIYVEIPNQQPASLKITLNDGQNFKGADFALSLSTPHLNPTPCPVFLNCDFKGPDDLYRTP